MGRGPHSVPLRALLRHNGVGSPRGRDPRGSRSSRIPRPRVAVPSGGGGGASSRLRGGGGPLLWLPSWGGGVGRPPPRPPAPSGIGLPSVAPGVPPRGILVPWGLPGGRGRRARSGRPPTGQCGGGGPPALVRAPVFAGPASSGGVWGRRFFGPPPPALGPEWEGGGGVGGALWSPGDAS